jgi:hypothetical protein
LAIHAFRFAYLLHPAQFHDDLLFLYESIVGSSTLSDLMFAKRALKILSRKASNHVLTDFLRSIYFQLISKGIITTRIVPDCGYFVFASPKIKMHGQAVMNEDFFELRGYPDYIRINLMAAHKMYLKGKVILTNNSINPI